jgi:hypothetical protein
MLLSLAYREGCAAENRNQYHDIISKTIMQNARKKNCHRRFTNSALLRINAYL